MESAESIVELYREHTQLSEPSDELVAQLLALLEPGEGVLFTCGWADTLFGTHAFVVALADGRTLEWEHLTNHQIEPATAAAAAALDALH